VADQRALRMAWLYPLRDLMGFAFWCASYTGRTIVWRGDWYRLEECGQMVLVQPGEATLAGTLAGTEVASTTVVADRMS
ncbi:MAG TPA: glycosyl transferase, partial [Candidatus Bathyarchaeia archaeon]|nr:glycosyl transferase [Candidatus Bathyarchaeia archaeon]